MSSPVRSVRYAAVRERILEGVGALLSSNANLTFEQVAKAAGIPERTVYRYFATRQALIVGLFEWTNHKIGFDGELPTTAASAVALVRRVFPGFDTMASIVHEILISPEGLVARRHNLDKRRQAAMAVVRDAAPALDRKSTRRVAAVVQLLTAAATWEVLRDYWDMDGKEAGEAAALAIELLLDGARNRAKRA